MVVDADTTSSAPRIHNWRIEPREYTRQESQRGRRFAYPNLDPRATALVVIDMVPFHVADNTYCRGIVPNINSLAEELRSAGGLVAWALPDTSPPSPSAIELFGPRTAETYSASGGSGPFRNASGRS